MDTPSVRHTPSVLVECDRCHRPGWRLFETGDIFVYRRVDAVMHEEGRPDDEAWPAVLRGSRRRGFRADPPPGPRAGAFVTAADHPESPFIGEKWRLRLSCTGRKHPLYERVVTKARAERAYSAAVAAGRDRIRLSEI
jgi:hypothetical protein